MALNASDVNAGDNILAAHQNAIIDDIEQHNHDGTVTAKLSASVLLATPVTRYFAVAPADLVPQDEHQLFSTINSRTYPGSTTDAANFNAGVHLPHGAIITSFKVFWYRSDASASASATLQRQNNVASSTEMALAHSNSSAGAHTVEDTSIVSGTVDNSAYTYQILIQLDPNDSISEVYFVGAIITFTSVYPYA